MCCIDRLNRQPNAAIKAGSVYHGTAIGTRSLNTLSQIDKIAPYEDWSQWICEPAGPYIQVLYGILWTVTPVGRVLVSLAAAISSYYFIYWVPFAFFESPYWIRVFVSLLLAQAGGWSVWRSSAAINPGIVLSVLNGALILGGLGFAAGFFGPIILNPEANQGPLLGLFIMGPLGFVVGGIGGFVRWLRRQRR